MYIPSTALCTSILIFGDSAGARVAVNVGIEEMESYVADTACACAADPLLCRTIAELDPKIRASVRCRTPRSKRRWPPRFSIERYRSNHV